VSLFVKKGDGGISRQSASWYDVMANAGERSCDMLKAAGSVDKSESASATQFVKIHEPDRFTWPKLAWAP